MNFLSFNIAFMYSVQQHVHVEGLLDTSLGLGVREMNKTNWISILWELWCRKSISMPPMDNFYYLGGEHEVSIQRRKYFKKSTLIDNLSWEVKSPGHVYPRLPITNKSYSI